MKRIKIFFVTDIHGSETCFKKFLNALKIYNVDVGILLGDLSGKYVIPIVKQKNETYESEFLGQKLILKTKKEVEDLQRKIKAIGYYPYFLTPEEMQELNEKKEKADQVFLNLILERWREWIKLLDERLKNSKVKVFIAPGNDDPLDLDEILDSSKVAVNVDNKKVFVDEHEMITLSYSNPTPWNTARECSEKELAQKIDTLVSQIEDMKSAIFNFHVPPYGTMLDQAPKISSDLVQSAGVMVSVGSKAVLEAIKKYQPLLGLHGHIHESRGVQKIGRTVCVNPGSEYSEGILRGVILTLEKYKVKSYMFTSG